MAKGKTLLALLSEMPGERGVVEVCVRSKDVLDDEVAHFVGTVLPILRKHNVQVQFNTNTNGMNGVWLSMDKYVLSRPNHRVRNWGFEYEAVLELCAACRVKIGTGQYNYLLDRDGTVEKVVEVMDDA